jgi:hypothetical protein
VVGHADIESPDLFDVLGRVGKGQGDVSEYLRKGFGMATALPVPVVEVPQLSADIAARGASRRRLRAFTR